LLINEINGAVQLVTSSDSGNQLRISVRTAFYHAPILIVNAGFAFVTGSISFFLKFKDVLQVGRKNNEGSTIICLKSVRNL
jgi:hypothetical protein